jgi:hypothetical protein
MTSAQRRNHWQGHHDAWRQSGLSQRAYCEQHALNYSTFTYWRTRVSVDAPQPSGKLIPLDLLSSRANVVITAGGVRVEIPSALLPEALPLVWRTLRDFL